MIEDIPAYLKLSDQIATSGQPNEAQLAEVAEASYQLVINLALTGKKYSLSDEAGLVRSLGMEYIHIPVIWTEPTRQNLEEFFAAMNANKDKKIFIHCAANMRASAFMALYRIKCLDWQADDAFQYMLKIWRPEGVWATFIQDILETHIF